MAPKSKLDKSRALAILGFSTSRPLDACFGHPEKARDILDEALYKKTQEILHGGLAVPDKGKKQQRKGSISRRKSNTKTDEDEAAVSFGRMDNLSMAEKNNLLHESYQFLVKKYIPKDFRKKMEQEKKDAAAAAAAAAGGDQAMEEVVVPEVIDSALDFSHLHS